MGSCIYCKKSAGFLKKTHKECERKHEEGKAEIISLVGRVGFKGGDPAHLQRVVEKVAEGSFINHELFRKLIVSGWEMAVEFAFDDGLLSTEEELALSTLKEHFELSQQELDLNGLYSKLAKGAILRDVIGGKVPERIRIDGNLPFNFQKNEKLVWLFKEVSYYEERSNVKYIGATQGLSVRIAKGVYYKAGAFKGGRVQTSESVHVDTGLLGVTDKHIYFFGESKRFRVSYNKIVSFEAFSDGLGIQRDAQTAKPQSFQTDDGWFAYNLIYNLAQMCD